MKRILFISSNIHTPWGGSEVLWYKSALFLQTQATGVAVCVIARKWPHTPRHIQEIKDAGGTVYTLPMHPTTPVEYVKGKLLGPVEKRRKKLLQKIAPDLLVHSMGKAFEGSDWMHIAAELSIPYVNLVQLASELQWPSNDEVDQYRDAYRSARCNCFVAKRNMELVCKQLGMELESAAVVRNPINVARRILPYPDTTDGFYLALPAQLVPIHKGQDILFEVLAQDKWKARPFYLHLYGAGEHEKSLRYYCHYLGLKNVLFKGYATNIEELWENNHLLVMSSRMEGLPLTLVEAMACGRAAVLTDVAGMNELVHEGETGFLAEAVTVDSFDDALERAWQAREQWQQMGIDAANRLQEHIPFDPVEEFSRLLLAQL